MVYKFDEGVTGQDALQPLEEGEIDNGRQRNTTPHGTQLTQHGRIAEREDGTRDVHHDRTASEGDNHRKEDGRDDTQSSRGVDKFTQAAQCQHVAAGNLEDRNGNGRTQQTEDQRHGGRGREAQRVVEIQEDDVGKHHAQVENHHLMEGEEGGVEHAVAGHLHHTTRGNNADDDTHRGDRQNGAHRGCLRTDGRVQEVHGIIGYTDKETREGQDAENNDDNGVEFTHRFMYGFSFYISIPSAVGCVRIQEETRTAYLQHVTGHIRLLGSQKYRFGTPNIQIFLAVTISSRFCNKNFTTFIFSLLIWLESRIFFLHRQRFLIAKSSIIPFFS